jgi:acyl-CoA reductase-like NAD-dependent aldehyde dehydrogenase
MPGTQQNYIGGTWVPAVAAAPNINPSNLNDVIADYARAQPAEADAAIAAATAAFAAYSRSTPQERYEALKKISDEILARKDELGRLLSREEGKTLPEGIGEVVRAGQVFAFFAGEAVRMSGEKIASTRPGIDVEITREPVGVVALITPWNFPMAIPAWKIAPALAYGNCVVFKPADLVPGSAHALAGIISKSGLPPGVFNLVMGRGSEIGDALLQASTIMCRSGGAKAQATARANRAATHLSSTRRSKRPIRSRSDAQPQ